MKNPTRAALLINSQSPHGDHLEGISADSRNIKSFLKSPLGGCFYDNEITILQNPTCQQVVDKLQNLNTDYLFVHVSSHGFSTQNGMRMICLSDGNLWDGRLLNKSLRQLVLIDACGNIPKCGARIGSVDMYEKEFDSFNGSWARQTFDKCITGSAYGKMIVHGAEFGQYAFEEHNRIGGQFTLSLLDSVQQMQLTGQEGYLPVRMILQLADEKLEKKLHRQNLAITHNTPGFNMPLGLISPRFVGPVRTMSVSAQKQPDLSGLIAASVLAIILVSMLK